MKARLLMCPPTHYRVAYEINPWMAANVGDLAPDAVKQWERLVETLGCAGDVEITMVESDAQTPDAVFTANAALVSGPLAIVSTFRHDQRKAEEKRFSTWFARNGFATVSLSGTYFEGAGDALFDRVKPLLYVGFGWRTERNAALRISEITGVRTVPLRLVDPRFYHLDTCFTPLGSGHVMVFMDAFSQQSQRVLRRHIEPERLIEISIEDALDFACNAVEIGDAIVLHDASRKLRARLHDAGYRVLATGLSEFMKAGGSAKCLTLKLEDGPMAAEAAA
jgi:N-dimethylarginine dimethylaminohydrolase